MKLQTFEEFMTAVKSNEKFDITNIMTSYEEAKEIFDSGVGPFAGFYICENLDSAAEISFSVKSSYFDEHLQPISRNEYVDKNTAGN